EGGRGGWRSLPEVERRGQRVTGDGPLWERTEAARTRLASPRAAPPTSRRGGIFRACGPAPRDTLRVGTPGAPDEPPNPDPPPLPGVGRPGGRRRLARPIRHEPGRVRVRAARLAAR